MTILKKVTVGLVTLVMSVGVSLATYVPSIQERNLLNVIYPMIDELTPQERPVIVSILERAQMRFPVGGKKHFFATNLLAYMRPTLSAQPIVEFESILMELFGSTSLDS